MEMTLDHALVIEAKAMVALAFRNGPIEALHAGKPCAVCSGNPTVSHISDEEMKAMMKSAVNTLYRLLWQRKNDSEAPSGGMIQNSRSPRESYHQPQIGTHERRSIYVQRACSSPARPRGVAHGHAG
jgi:hypothetical protein